MKKTIKRTEVQRLEDEILVYEDNRVIIEQFLQKSMKAFAKKNDVLEIDLKNLEGWIDPESGYEIHKMTLVAKRKFDNVSKAVVDCYKQKQYREVKERRRVKS